MNNRILFALLCVCLNNSICTADKSADKKKEAASRRLAWDVIERDNLYLARVLLNEKGADANYIVKLTGDSCKMSLLSRVQSPEMVGVLVEECGADVNLVIGGQTALHWAARAMRTKVVEKLLELKADVNAQDGEPYGTPFHCLVLSEEKSKELPKIFKMLIDAKANPSAKTRADKTVLDCALASKNIKAVELLQTI